jgi:DNA-binding PadR family transcriptional regulator
MRSNGNTQYLEAAVLGLLTENPQHGYELQRRIVSAFGALFHPSWGSIYPALSRLERQGYIETSEEPKLRSLLASTGSLGGDLATFKSSHRKEQPPKRQRKSYRITDRGAQLLHDLLSGMDVTDDRAFWVALAFSDRLSPNRRLSIANRRIYALEERMKELKENELLSGSTMRSLALQGIYLRLTEELSWLEGICKDLSESEEGDSSVRR